MAPFCDGAAMKDYSKSALMEFIETSIKKGWVNVNTGGGIRTACRQILDQVGDAEDVRQVNVADAIQQYANRFPAKLSGDSLRVYQSRIQGMIESFTSFIDDPVNYKPSSKGGTQRPAAKNGAGIKQATTTTTAETPAPAPAVHHNVVVRAVATDTSMTLPFNLRPDFLAQVTIPRDMTKDEAKRLTAFIDALAVDKPA